MKMIKTTLSRALSSFASCVIPTIPIMIAAGIIKVALIILGPLVLNILPETSSTYVVLEFSANAGYYFMPIFVAISSADVFKTNRYVAGLLGAILLSPSFIQYVEAGKKLTIFGLNVAMTSYASQVLPSVLAVWIMSYVYRFFSRIIDKRIDGVLVPPLTILVMIPVVLCDIGPLGVYLGGKLVELVLLLKNIGPLGNAIMTAIIPFVTMFGLGGTNASAMILLSSSGVDPILFFSNVIYNTTLGFVTLAIYLKDRKSDTLACAITSAVAGASEPALFSVVMNDFWGMVSLITGGFLGGLYSGFTGVKAYAMASFGVFGCFATIGQDSLLSNALISLAIGSISGFLLSYITHKKQAKKSK